MLRPAPGLCCALFLGVLPVQPLLAQECFIGEIRYFAGNYAPRDWALAQGQLLPISQNQALYSILGTTYGGDGRNTFGLPDLRGRTAIGAGQGPGLSQRGLGQALGSETTVLGPAQLPAHSHSASTTVQAGLRASSAAATTGSPAGSALANTGREAVYASTAPDLDMGAGGIQASASTQIGNTGGGQPLGQMQPSLALNPIICMQGIYPSRN